MIVQSFRHRFGLIIVIVGAGCITALVTGMSALAVILGFGAVFILGIALTNRRDQSASSRSARAIGAPYSDIYKWVVDQQPDLTGIVETLDREGFGLKLRRQSSNCVELSGGSQLWMRLWGGYFVSPRRLPIQLELKTARDRDGAGYLVELSVHDNFGIAVRDGALGDQFSKATRGLGKAVEADLMPMAGFRPDPTLTTDVSNQA